MRYPKEIFAGRWAGPMGLFFTFVVPILVVINVPAHTLIKVIDPRMVLFMGGVTLVLVYASRKFFFLSLRRYRSASS
jgi:ABC-2 type transport system permease protein